LSDNFGAKYRAFDTIETDRRIGFLYLKRDILCADNHLISKNQVYENAI